MKNLKTISVALLFLLTLNTRLLNAEDGFRLTDLNPFATKKATPTPDTPTEKPTNRSYFPKLPTFNLMPQAKPGQPTTWQRLNNGTTSFFSNAWKTVTFQNTNTGAVSPQARRITGSQRIYDGSPSRAKTPAKTSGGLRSFFESKTEDPKPKKPTDFLKQPRVPFE